jgi:hypothetical protein
VSLVTETIFSHAVALHQAGRLRNTIYVSGHTVFIFNIDKTVLLKFSLPRHEPKIEGEVSFLANDYDSEDFEEKDGKIIFTTHAGDYIRRKLCIAPEKTFGDMQELYQKYLDCECFNKVVFSSSILSLLDNSLSHMEIFSENKKSVVIQRDIYTGSVIRIDRDISGFGLSAADDIKKDFSPIGIRTGDFIALFSFCDNVTFHFGNNPYALVAGDKFKMEGIISGCVYDELGTVSLSKGESENGRRQEQKIGRGKQKARTTVNEGSAKEDPKRRCRK